MYETILVANLILWLGWLIYFMRSDDASIYHPASYYLFFHGLIFTLRPIYAHLMDFTLIYQIFQFNPSKDEKITTIFISMISLTCFMVTCLYASKDTRMRFGQTAGHVYQRRYLMKPFMITVLLCGPIGLASVLSSWSNLATDSSTMIYDASTGFKVNTTGNGYFVDAQLMLLPLAIICAWLFRFRLWSVLPMLLYILLKAGTGGRWPFILGSATMALLYLYDRKRLIPSGRLLLILPLLTILFVTVGLDRGKAIRSLFSTDITDPFRYANGDVRAFEGMDFANLEFTEYLVHVVPKKTGNYTYFLDNLQLLTEPVPRVLWPGKPVGPPIKFFSLFDYGKPSGMTYSLAGQGWIQLGYLGVVIWSSLFGWAFGWVYARFCRSRQSNFAVMCYLMVLPVTVTFLRDGVPLTMIKSSLFLLLPIWIWRFIAIKSGVPEPSALLRAYRARQAAVQARRLENDAVKPEWQPRNRRFPAPDGAPYQRGA